MVDMALSREFMTRLGKLDRGLYRDVQKTIDKVHSMASMHELRTDPGLNLEGYNHQRDPRARTMRVSRSHRAIVYMPETEGSIIFCDVLNHPEADRWMLKNEFRVNPAHGALEIVDVERIDAEVEAARRAAEVPTSEKRPDHLFDHRRDQDFTHLGVDGECIDVVRAFTTEDQVLSFLAVAGIPEVQQSAIMALAGDDPLEDIWRELAGDIDRDQIDPDDIEAAVTVPAAAAHFHVVTDEDDLADMLAQPLAQWRTYLHHSQARYAYRDTYNGPARITGGAGTGKTVVAIHRAKALADRLEPGAGATSKPILFTTFTRNLAQAIERDLTLLGGAELLDHVEVLNVDRLAHQIVKGAERRVPRPLDNTGLEELWEEKLEELGLIDRHTARFVIAEWEDVVIAQELSSRNDYFRASRVGRGVRLDRRGRAEVWRVIEAATNEMENRGVATFLQLANKAAGYLNAETVKPYRHVIVDEAQDLHAAQWRLLRAAAPEAPNDLFIVGDAHQRIYGRRTSLRSVGVHIVGRSHRLRINYRTTRQILRWALTIIGDAGTDDLDEGTETQQLAEYHSFLEGPEPTVNGFDTRGDMLEALTTKVQHWIDVGVDPSDIGVVGRDSGSVKSVLRSLRDVGVPAGKLGRDLQDHDGVSVGTMHRMKGLEARCIAIVGIDDDNLPSPLAITAESEDPVQHRIDLEQERALLYVSSTRARDDLWVGWTGEPSRFLAPVLENISD